MADPRLTVQIDGRDNLSAELKKIESGVIRFVGAVSSALTTIAAIGFPVREAANFQKEILNAAKTTEYGAEQMLVLENGLRSLSNQLDITAVDLAKIATLGGQMGIGAGENAQALVAFTKTTATAVSSLGLSAEEVVNSFGKLINIFAIPQDQFRNAMSAILAVANQSTAAADQLFDVVRRIGNLGGAVSLPDATALSASMIDLGLTAETAGTTLTKIFADFKSNAKEFAAVVKSDAIKTTEDWINLLQSPEKGGGIKALNAYADALNNMSVADASALKGRLTGEGRLFEAISKIQEQRRRELALTKLAEDAEKRYRDATAGRLELTIAATEALRVQSEALRESATQASVIGKLSKTAQEAWLAGDSAEKAQRLALSGLTSQWTVFLNNIKTLAGEVGRVFLPPLTQALMDASAALQNPVNADSLKRAAFDILNAIKAIGAGIAQLRSYFEDLKGDGIDWGAFLRVGALLASFAALKGIISLLGALSGTLLKSIPGFSALSTALLGTVAPAKASAAAVTEAGAAATNTGNIFTTVAGRIAAGLLGVVTGTEKLRSSLKEKIDTTSMAQSNALAKNAEILALKRLSNLQSISAINARIYQQEQALLVLQQRPRKNAAQITGVKGDITFLTRQRDALRANEIAAAQYGAQLAVLQKQIAAVNVGSVLRNPFANINALAASAAAAGRRMATAFATNFRVGAQAGMGGLGASISAALAPAIIRAQAVGAAIGTSILNGFLRADAAATISARKISDAFARIYRGAIVAATGIARVTTAAKTLGAAGLFSGLITGLAGVAGVLGKLAVGGAVGGIGAIWTILKGLGGGIRNTILGIAGLGDKWTEAKTKGEKAFIGMSAGVVALGKGLAVVGRLFLSAFNFVFIGIMMIDILKAIGLWDKLAESIGNVIKMLGMEVPSFLQSDKEARAAAREADEIRKNFEAATEQASKFTNEMRGLVLMSQDVALTVKDITFDPEAPAKAMASASQYLTALITGLSKRSEIQGRIEVQERKLTLEKQKQVAAEQALKAAMERTAKAQPHKGTPGSTTPVFTAESKAVKETAAAVSLLEEEIAKLKKQKDGLGDFSKGFENVAKLAFSSAEATALFGRSWDMVLSPMEQFADNQAELIRQTRERATAQKDFEDATRKAGDSAVAQKEVQDTYGEAVKQADDRIKGLTDSQKRLVESMRRAVLDPKAVDAIIKTLETNVDASSIKEAVAELQKIPLIDFKGVAIPKVTATNIVEAGVTYEVNKRLSDMYGKWASVARTAAEQAKGYATQVLGEVARLARRTEDFLEGLRSKARATQQKASNQLEDRADDADSRQRLRNLQTQYDVERALLEQQFQIKDRLLAEQEAGGVRVFAQKQQAYAFENQALFELEEKFNKLKELEQDRLNIKKAQRGVQQELQQYDELIKKLDFYKQSVEAANKVIADPEAAADKRLGALEKRNNALDKMRAIYGQLESTAEKLTTLDPIGGQLLISPDQLARIQQGVDKASDLLGQTMMAGADEVSGAWANVAKSLTDQTDIFARTAIQARNQLEGFGMPIAEAAGHMGRLLGSSQAFRDFLSDIQERTAAGFSDMSNIDFSEITKKAKEAIDELSKLPPGKASVLMTIDEKNLAEQVKNSMLSGITLATTEAPPEIPVDISQASLGMMKDKIEKLDPVIKADIDIDQIHGGSGTFTMTQNRARGGLIGDVVRLSLGTMKGVSAFARGGLVGWNVTNKNTTNVIRNSLFNKKSTDTSVIDRSVIDRNRTDSATNRSVTDHSRIDSAVNRSLTDRRVTDRSAVSRSLADRSSVDRSLVDRRVTDKSVIEKIVRDGNVTYRKLIDQSAVSRSLADRILTDRRSTDTSTVRRSLFDQSVVDKRTVETEAVRKSLLDKSIIEKRFADMTAVSKLLLDRSIVDRRSATADSVRKSLLDRSITDRNVTDTETVRKSFVDRKLIEEIARSSNVTYKNITDKSAVSRSLADRILTDRKLVDTSLVSKSLVDRSSTNRQHVNKSTEIKKFASGGVSGPGGGTDDRILAWLSNGEYVMDALTTAAFGPKFFKYLQNMARGGTSLSILNKLQIPRFAAGGMPSMSIPAIANDFKMATVGSAPKDVINVNLSLGGQRATIQAEREQAMNLVSILRNFERGR